MEYSLLTASGMDLVASGSRPLPDGLRDALAAVWSDVREGVRYDGEQLLPLALQREIESLQAFYFRGALWLLSGGVLEEVDQGAGLKSVHHDVADVLDGELGQRLVGRRLEPAFVLDEARALWFLKGTVDEETVAFPVVFDASPAAASRWQVLYPDLEVSPNDWRIAAAEPRSLFATDDDDVFELRGTVPALGAPVTTRWTLRLARGRYHFGEAKALRARPPLVSTTPLPGATGRERNLCFHVVKNSGGRCVIEATRFACDNPLLWFKPYDRQLSSVDSVLCRGSVQGDEAITLDVTSPDALTVRYWRTRR